MSALETLRLRLRACKVPAAGQYQVEFLPEGSLCGLFSLVELVPALSDPAFKIPDNKLRSTADIVMQEGLKVFAILVELRLEYVLGAMIKNDCLDLRLPFREDDLNEIAQEAAKDILRKQWDYMPYMFRKGFYQRKIQDEKIIPFIKETRIGGGGFSIVYESFIHPCQQKITECAPLAGLCVARKEIRHLNQGSGSDDEAELLFLLGSLRHANVVELLASYKYRGMINLLFPRADSDLHQFLLLSERPPEFKDDFSIFGSLHGLSSGLAYLHNFRLILNSSDTESARSFRGYHHDIKPRNILIQNGNFILADFGLSKLKSEDEPTETTWKDSTYEYGAPECRNPQTFVPGKVGRAFDVWSMACVFSEVLVFIEAGAQGVQEFREHRLVDNYYGKTRSFHDNNSLSGPVDEYLKSMEQNFASIASRSLTTLIRSMFSTEPEYRPKSTDVEVRMASITLESLILTISQTIEQLHETLAKSGKSTIFGIRLGLEITHFEAWAAVLGLLPLRGSRKPYHHLTTTVFLEARATLRSTVQDLRNRPDFDSMESNQEYVVSTIHHAINRLCDLLPHEMRISVDDTFAILSTTTDSWISLRRIQSATEGHSTELEDIAVISTMKYMSILLETQGNGSSAAHRIERSLVTADICKHDPEIGPEPYWYAYGFRNHEKRRVLVEHTPFRRAWAKDPNSQDFEKLGKQLFGDIESLLNMLQQEPKPPNFRVLKCLGAYPDLERCQFGIVYSYPDENTIAVKLHSLFQYQRCHISPPGPSERLALATALITSMHTFHISGWLHKDMNSHNVLFFCKSVDPLRGLEFESPYIVGFKHSRQNNPRAYSAGRSYTSTSQTDYQDPEYQRGGRFRQQYAIYSIGLLLLEIGLWSSLGAIGALYPELDPEELKDKYLQCCEKLDNLGRKYQAVTRVCLQADKWHDDGKGSLDLKFQEEVVEKLRSCSI